MENLKQELINQVCNLEEYNKYWNTQYEIVPMSSIVEVASKRAHNDGSLIKLVDWVDNFSELTEYDLDDLPSIISFEQVCTDYSYNANGLLERDVVYDMYEATYEDTDGYEDTLTLVFIQFHIGGDARLGFTDWAVFMASSQYEALCDLEGHVDILSGSMELLGETVEYSVYGSAFNEVAYVYVDGGGIVEEFEYYGDISDTGIQEYITGHFTD